MFLAPKSWWEQYAIDQLMKNLPTQLETKKKNRKIYYVWLVKKPPNLWIGYFKEKNQKRSNKKEFFDCLVVVVDPTSWFYFYYIRISMVGLGISGLVSLNIGRAILTEINIAVGCFRLFLW